MPQFVQSKPSRDLHPRTERRHWEGADSVRPSFVCLLQLPLGFGNKNCPFFPKIVRGQHRAAGDLPVTLPCLAPGAAGAGEQSWEHPRPGRLSQSVRDRLGITCELPGNYL